MKKADDLMSLYIRKKYASHEGYVLCCSCEKRFHWKVMDCGHFISRRHLSTRYVEENAHPEDKYCNRFNHDHHIGYTQFMIKTYGNDMIEWLKKESKRTLSQSEKRAIIEDAIEYYGNKIKESGYEMQDFKL